MLSYDVAAARVYGQIRAQIESAGRPLADADLQIAATAILHHLELVTLSSDGRVEYQGLLLADLAVDGVRLPGACRPCVVPPGGGNGLRAVEVPPVAVRLHWADLAGAASYQATGSLGRDRASGDWVGQAPGGGAAGLDHPGVLGDGRSWYYDLRGRGNCGTLGP